MRDDTSEGTPTLYGIGIGPGDPELITLKGLSLIEKVTREGGTVFVPAGKLVDGSLAKEIVRRTGTETSNWRELEFPMTTDTADLEARWREAAETITAVLCGPADSARSGAAGTAGAGSAAFLTLGDPSVFSTWIYLRRQMEILHPEIRCLTVPGIQTMNAAAALLELPLVEGKEKLAFLPAPDDPEELDSLLPHFDTIVLYKIGKRFPGMRSYLERKGFSQRAWYVERLGLPGEVAVRGMGSLPDTASGYLSTIILKTGGPV
jgi:precorrin-2/cobalt-factor-2 C20-methyltransferase